MGASASLNGLAKTILVRPSIEEVAVKAVSGGVAICVNEAVIVDDRPGVVEELEEDGEDGGRVRLRANTSVVVTDSGESHLR